MTAYKDLPPLPGAHYGKIEGDGTPDPDSPLPDADRMDDDDDDDYEGTDQSLIDMLGFDPEEWRNDEEEPEIVKNQDGSISKRKK